MDGEFANRQRKHKHNPSHYRTGERKQAAASSAAATPTKKLAAQPKKETKKAASFDVTTRKGRADIAADTLAILKAGKYINASGVEHKILLPACLEATILYAPQDVPVKMGMAGATLDRKHDTSVQVVHCSTLECAQRLIVDEKRSDVCLLNFASARRAGGGFLEGAAAQEESLARSSALYPCLMLEKCKPFYTSSAQDKLCLYSHHVIYSPAVPVFRRDNGALLSAPYSVAMVTAAAPNRDVAFPRLRTHFAGNEAKAAAVVRQTMAERVARVLAITAAHGHKTLVLGAFGCGVFGNLPREVARCFRDTLEGPFRGVFDYVAFAIYDEGENLDAFRSVFADWTTTGKGADKGLGAAPIEVKEVKQVKEVKEVKTPVPTYSDCMATRS